MQKLIVLFIISLVSLQANACRISYGDNAEFQSYQLLSSPYQGQWRSYIDGHAEDLKNKKISISGCANNANLMISRGLVVPNDKHPLRDILYQDKFYLEERCSIENYYLSRSEQINRTRNLKERFQLLNDCFSYKIKANKEFISKLINNHSDQYDLEKNKICSFSQEDENTIIMKANKTGACLLKLDDKSKFDLEYQIDKKCNDLNYFANNNIEIQEIRSETNFYTLEKFDANSAKTNIGSHTGIIHFNPNISKNIAIANFPINKVSNGLKPAFIQIWPLEITLADVNLRRIEYTQNKVKNIETLIQAIVFVDNRCPSYCSKNLCSSPCNYSHPAYAKVSLYKVDKGKNIRQGHSWYVGGSAQAQWAGTISNQYFRKQGDLNVGEIYQLKISYKNPKKMALKYIDFLNNYGDYFVSENVFNVNFDLSSLAELPKMDTMTDMDELSPLDDNLDRLDIVDEEQDLRFWPPNYSDRWLGDIETSAVRIDSGKDKSNLNIYYQFQVESIQGSKITTNNKRLRLESSFSINEICNNLGGKLSEDRRYSRLPFYSCEANFKPKHIKCNYFDERMLK